jgi:hypothetical protein
MKDYKNENMKDTRYMDDAMHAIVGLEGASVV